MDRGDGQQEETKPRDRERGAVSVACLGKDYALMFWFGAKPAAGGMLTKGTHCAAGRTTCVRPGTKYMLSVLFRKKKNKKKNEAHAPPRTHKHFFFSISFLSSPLAPLFLFPLFPLPGNAFPWLR